jgi:hypothetical protein
MLFNEIDIFTCKFFTLNKEGKLQFIYGKHRGKSVDDFNNVSELHDVTSYCFWILKKKNVPLVSKYGASAFLKAITPKFIILEKELKRITIKNQKEMLKKNEASAKTTGTRYA